MFNVIESPNFFMKLLEQRNNSSLLISETPLLKTKFQTKSIFFFLERKEWYIQRKIVKP